jgi:hypothetical protein
MKILLYFLSVAFLFVCSCNDEEPDNPVPTSFFQLTDIRFNATSYLDEEAIDIPSDIRILLDFSEAIDSSTVSSISLTELSEGGDVNFSVTFLDQEKTISIQPDRLKENTSYELTVTDELRSNTGSGFRGYQKTFTILQPPLQVLSISANGDNLSLTADRRNVGLPLQPSFTIVFNNEIEAEDFQNKIFLIQENNPKPVEVIPESDSSLLVTVLDSLRDFSRGQLLISRVETSSGQIFNPFSLPFFTQIDTTPDFPQISQEELLTKVTEQTFKYFWDFGHPVSGLARERNTSGETVTIGGSGFGVMSIIVGIERGFITREQGVARLQTIVDFLSSADRFHGVWPHWMNGTTGETIPFSQFDDGADLVETSFMIQALLTARQYLNPQEPTEQAIITVINQLYDEVEWTWFTKGGEEILYWHWSPNYDWEMNLPVRGWNESLIVYVLAASSNTFPIDKTVYDAGWARNGGIQNGREFYGINLPLGEDRGGPLFFAHYSFLGLDPRNLSDAYAHYFEQNRSHTLINRAYCVNNPGNYVGYSEQSWGLTASDNNEGYSAHSPNNDLGVITPTAALSSMPYTPEESIEVMNFLYYQLGDRMWGPYGFYDAYNPTAGWYADSYLAIDQGPIICMIENYRTGLLWNLFMSAPEVQNGLQKLGFNY